jgi:hypothetical protein
MLFDDTDKEEAEARRKSVVVRTSKLSDGSSAHF